MASGNYINITSNNWKEIIKNIDITKAKVDKKCIILYRGKRGLKFRIGSSGLSGQSDPVRFPFGISHPYTAYDKISKTYRKYEHSAENATRSLNIDVGEQTYLIEFFQALIKKFINIFVERGSEWQLDEIFEDPDYSNDKKGLTKQVKKLILPFLSKIKKPKNDEQQSKQYNPTIKTKINIMSNGSNSVCNFRNITLTTTESGDIRPTVTKAGFKDLIGVENSFSGFAFCSIYTIANYGKGYGCTIYVNNLYKIMDNDSTEDDVDLNEILGNNFIDNTNDKDEEKQEPSENNSKKRKHDSSLVVKDTVVGIKKQKTLNKTINELADETDEYDDDFFDDSVEN